MRLDIKKMYNSIKNRVHMEDAIELKDKPFDDLKDFAGNTDSPKKLAYLSTHEDTWIRRLVASNKNTPIHILVNLSNDPNEYVRLSVSKNQKTPKDVLKKLMSDSFPAVAKTATETYSKVSGGLQSLPTSMRNFLGPIK
jgi:hypothetical protein